MPVPLLYEINTRSWLRELSQGAGERVTLNSVPDSQFEEWQRWGVSHLWLMGLWETAPASIAFSRKNAALWRTWSRLLPEFRTEDITGSAYAIAGYQVSAALNGGAALATFRKRLNRAGIQLIADFIPNHTGLDHPWVGNFPERFVHSQKRSPGAFRVRTKTRTFWIAHGKDPYFPPWADTAQLDYRNPETRKAVMDELLSLAQRCDGVRCDMSMLLLNDIFAETWKCFPSPCPPLQAEFWEEAISTLKAAFPSFLFLAEAYWETEARLIDVGFDYVYDKRVYDLLVRRQPGELQQFLLSRSPSFLAHSAHFLENHDEPRIASLLAPEEHRAAALLMLSLPGLRFLHQGQITGAKLRASVHLDRHPSEGPSSDIRRMYEEVLVATSTLPLEGCAILQPVSAWPGNPTYQNFVVLQWQAKPQEFALVVVNLAPHRSQCRVRPAASDLPHYTWLMADRLSSEKHLREGADMAANGLFLDVRPHGAQLFGFTPAFFPNS